MNASDYRYERKFLIKGLSTHEVKAIVRMHPAVFSEIYHKRSVNNIYFDSHNYKNFRENIDGNSDRIKIRIRWYGDLFGKIDKPVMEIKIKNGFLGRKISIPVKPFHFVNGENILDILSSITFLKKHLLIYRKSLVPTLMNTYTREYYISNDKNYRITIDNMQSFYKFGRGNNTFLNKLNDRNTVILELKYGQNCDSQADRITEKFPFRMTKSSKYVTGVQQILQMGF